MRIDEDKLETLRRWGQALRQAGAKEHAAAGRAILMLIAEIEQLQVELSHARPQESRVAPMATEDAVAGGEDSVERALTLPERLQQALSEDPDGTTLASDGTTSSPESWIESLRRRK